MRKSDKWRIWFQASGELTPDGQALILGWARRGLIDEQIAANMAISLSTLKNWKRKHPSFFNALRIGKDVADYMVENALFKRALEGDTTAMIFWLKNRRPKEYRDKHEIEQNGTMNLVYSDVAILDDGTDSNGETETDAGNVDTETV